MTGRPGQSGGENALEVRGLWKAYVTRPVLRDVDLTVALGEVVYVCGVNGAGKSTLLRAIGGLIQPDRGRIVLAGVDLQVDPLAARRRLGLISHASMTYPELTVQENLVFAADLYGVRSVRRRVDNVLREVGLEAFRHDRAGILSRGLLQRLAIARALVHEPVVLLADEPFTGLDTGACDTLVERLGCFVRAGGTLVLTTHHTALGLRCSHRVVVLDGGRVIFDEPADRIDTGRFVVDYLGYAREAVS